MRHYYAIAEAGDSGSWWINFPGSDGIVSVADDSAQIVAQARDALESAAMDGGLAPTDLSDFKAPAMIVVIPFALAPIAVA